MPRLLGILISVLSMHLVIVRPLLHRVDRLESELHAVALTLAEMADQSQPQPGHLDRLWDAIGGGKPAVGSSGNRTSPNDARRFSGLAHPGPTGEDRMRHSLLNRNSQMRR
jgi:hypothetical protein